MKALFIGGTGIISSGILRPAIEAGWELTLLNRGNRSDRLPPGVELLAADVSDEPAVARLLGQRQFDVVADFIAFNPDQVDRDIRLFRDRARQFIFISSASAYQKPLGNFLITESTPLANPFWEYSRDKIACEERLIAEYRATGFPATIVRPSHTYDERTVPTGVHGAKGAWQVIDRIRRGRPVLVHGDGETLWTLTHNSDFAKGFLGLMGNGAAIGEAVHITSDESLTWNRIYDILGEALGVKTQKFHVASDFLAACDPSLAPGLLGDKAHSVRFDNSKLKRLVPGFVATTRFEQGVRASLQWLLAHPEAQHPDPEFDAFCDNVMKSQATALDAFQR